MAPPEVKVAWTSNPANSEYIKDKFLTGNRIMSPIYSQRPNSRHTFDTLSSVSELSVASIRSFDSLFLAGDQHKPSTSLAAGSEFDQQAESKTGFSSKTSLPTCGENPYVATSQASPVSIYSSEAGDALNRLPFVTQVKIMDTMWSMSRKLTIQNWIDALDYPPYSDVSSYDSQSSTPGPIPEPKEANRFRDFFQNMLQRLTRRKTKVTEIEILPCNTDGVNKDDDTASSSSCKASRKFRSRVQKFFSRFVVCGKANQD